MNILFFTRLFHPHIGGVEKYVYELSKQFIKKGHNVIVVSELHDKKIPMSENWEGIEIYRIPVSNKEWSKKFLIWKWFFQHKNLIEKADVIHCHDVFFWYLPFRFIYLNKPVYTTFQGYEEYPVSKKAIILRKISELLSWGNICTGDFIKKWYGTKPSYVSYGGVNIDEYKQSGIKNKKSAVFVGRLDAQTSVETYLEGIQIIKRKIPNFEFIVVGDGELRKQTQRYAKVVGFQKNLNPYFRKYNFAFVSRYLTILQAMINKRLVFSVYDNPLKRDYLKMSPFAEYVVIVDSPKKLASEVISYMKNSKKEEKIVREAFLWASKQTWESLAYIYLKLWKKN